MKNKILFLIALIILAAASFIYANMISKINLAEENNSSDLPLVLNNEIESVAEQTENQNTDQDIRTIDDKDVVPEKQIPTIKQPEVNKTGTVIYEVPFVSQAPFGEWSDPRQEDGCEEASALMAVSWAKGKTAITKTEAKNEILAISKFEENKTGDYRDYSAADTLNIIINEYFNFQNAELKKVNSVQDIIDELYDGNVLIAPMNGQALGNPNFTPPGPINHMLVIVGYDDKTQEFITNDPGTRNGKNYRYSSKVLLNALRNYPTGYHESNILANKVMIVVSPEKN